MYSKKANRLVENLVKATRENALGSMRHESDQTALERHARNVQYDLLNYIAELEEKLK